MKNNQFRSQSQNQSKSSISQNRIPPPSSYTNSIKISKRNINNSSSHSISSINVNKNLDFKDSLEGSISESRTNLLIPDSLNNTKSSIGNNYLSKKNSKNKIKINNYNNIKENKIKINQNNNNEEKTKKIDYRFYSQFSFKFGGGTTTKNKEKESNKYWLAVYDKLMKTKKILKILSYYEKEKNKIDKMINNNINNKQENIKEQLLIIKDFDIYFMKPLNRPFIKYVKGNCIFTKIYLLTFEQIIFILNYINRYKLAISPKISNLLLEKGSYQKINETYKNFPYNLIYGMGSYMNINIIGFSNYNIQDQNNLSCNSLNQNYPNSRKIAKLVKLLMINFPKYSFKFFVCYLLSKLRFENFEEKTNEIKNIVYSINKSFMPLKPQVHKKIISNSLIHSSYSPLSNNDDLSLKMKGRDINNYTDNNNNIYNYNTNINNYNYNNYFVQKKHRIKSNNLSKEFHTFDNRIYKYYKTNQENKINIIRITNYKNKKSNLSEKKNHFKKHSESVYLNGYIGKETNMNYSTFNKTKLKKTKKEIRTSIKHLISNFNSSRTSINKNKKRLNKSEMLKININNHNINYIQVKNEKKENDINKQKEKKGTDIFNANNNINNYKEDKFEEKMKSKKRNKLNLNTKSEETKICTTNKEGKNNSIREINKENTGIFVVSKKIISDDFLDDDSSIELNNKGNENNNNSDINNGQSVEYFTPKKKKNYKYYS